MGGVVYVDDTARVVINLNDVNEAPAILNPQLKMSVGERALRKPGKVPVRITDWTSVTGQQVQTVDETAFKPPLR